MELDEADKERSHWYREPEPEEPAWPDTQRCECCGADVFVVTSQDGEDLVIDAKPMRLIVAKNAVGVEHVMRADVRFQFLRRESGHRLHDPQLFRGYIGDDDSPDAMRRGLAMKPSWEWFSTRMTLDDAHANSARIHSEHFFTCPNVSKLAIEAKQKNCALTGEAAGSMTLKKLRPAKVEQIDDNFYNEDALCDAAFADMQASDF